MTTDSLARLLTELGAHPEKSDADSVTARFPRVVWARQGLASFGVTAEQIGTDSLRLFPTPDLHHALFTTLSPEALLFDMDGVMVDVSGSYRQAILETLKVYGVQLDPAAIGEAKRAGSCNNDWELTYRLLDGRIPLEEVTATFEELYQGTSEKPGLRATERLLLTREWLDGLGLPLGIVTGRPVADCQRLLDEHQLSSAFRTRVCMGEAPAKPSPAPTRLALERLGLERAWLIGDTVDDIRSARAAGVIGLGILAPGEEAGPGREALLAAGAARVLTTLKELEELLP